MPWQLARRSLPVVTGHVSRPLSTHWHLARPDQKRHGSLPVPGPLDKTNRATGRTRQDGMACRDGAERHGWVARPRPSSPIGRRGRGREGNRSPPAASSFPVVLDAPRRGGVGAGGRPDPAALGRFSSSSAQLAAPDSDSPLLVVGFSVASRVLLILVQSDGSV